MKTGEEEFELWWKSSVSYGYDVPALAGMKLCCEAAFKAALVIGRKSENEAIRQYIVDQGTIVCGGEDVYNITDDDLEAIRRRVEEEK